MATEFHPDPTEHPDNKPNPEQFKRKKSVNPYSAVVNLEYDKTNLLLENHSETILLCNGY